MCERGWRPYEVGEWRAYKVGAWRIFQNIRKETRASSKIGEETNREKNNFERYILSLQDILFVRGVREPKSGQDIESL